MNSLNLYFSKPIVSNDDDIIFGFIKPRSEHWKAVWAYLKNGRIYLCDDIHKEYCVGFSFTEKDFPFIKSIWHCIRGWKTAFILIRGFKYNSTDFFDNWFECFLRSLDVKDKDYYCIGRTIIKTSEESYATIELPCHYKNRFTDIWYNHNDPEDVKKQFFRYCVRTKQNLCPLFNIGKMKEDCIVHNLVGFEEMTEVIPGIYEKKKKKRRRLLQINDCGEFIEIIEEID